MTSNNNNPQRKAPTKNVYDSFQSKKSTATQEELYDTMEDEPDPVYQPPRGPPRGPAPSQQPHSRPKVDLNKMRQNSSNKVTLNNLNVSYNDVNTPL